MADSIVTKQALIDAQKDAQALEEVINGEPGKLIKTRLGRYVYTLASIPQINTMTREEVTSALAPKADKSETAAALDTKANQADTFLKSEVTGLVAPKADKIYVDTALVGFTNGAAKFYPTLVEANADIANIGIKDKVEVGEVANGGTWYKATAGATSLTKSPYDPLAQGKDYTDEKTEAIELTGNTTILHAVVSADGSVIEHIDALGRMFLCGDSVPLQEQLITAPAFPYRLLEDGNVLAVVDNLGQSFLHINDTGGVFIGGGSDPIQYQIKQNKAKNYINSVALSQQETSRITLSKAVLAANKTPFFKLVDVASYTGVAGEIQRIAAIMKVAEGRILCFWGSGVAGYDGDAQGVKLYKTFINYDRFNNITVEPKVLFREPPSIEQVSKHPMLGRLNDGRIILIWDDGVWTGYKQYVAYSADNGMTWTAPVLLFDNSWVTGSTGKIITLLSGRLVMPMYANNTTFLVYSDDNGATWLQSNILSNATYNLVEPTAELNASGEIIVAIRSQANKKYRYYAKSVDGGETLIDLGQNTTLPSNDCASSLAFDTENGLMFHAVPSAIFSRTAYEVRVSSDGGYDFPIKYHPFDDQEYIGYSQIIALGGNKYAVVAEGFNMLSATINRKENLKIAIFNLNEVIHNVRTN